MPCKKPLNLVNIFHWKGCGEIIGKSQACGGKSMSVWVITSWVGGVQSASFTSLVTSGCIATLMSLSPSPGLSSLLTVNVSFLSLKKTFQSQRLPHLMSHVAEIIRVPCWTLPWLRICEETGYYCYFKPLIYLEWLLHSSRKLEQGLFKI